MEIVNFYEKTFRQIPGQDNPAFMTKKEWDAINQNGCILITKQQKQKLPYINCGKICVLKIEPTEYSEEEETVTHLGLFWELEHALLFAKTFIDTH